MSNLFLEDGQTLAEHLCSGESLRMTQSEYEWHLVKGTEKKNLNIFFGEHLTNP